MEWNLIVPVPVINQISRLIKQLIFGGRTTASKGIAGQCALCLYAMYREAHDGSSPYGVVEQLTPVPISMLEPPGGAMLLSPSDENQTNGHVTGL